MDELDRAIVDRLQAGFPVCERPFLEAARTLGTSEDDLIARIDRLLREGTLTRFGPLFHVEVLYGGVFQISGVAQDQIEQVLLIECPRFLFPFARRIIADVTADGGFPPFLLDPIDFAGVYAARQAQGPDTVGTA